MKEKVTLTLRRIILEKKHIKYTTMYYRPIEELDMHSQVILGRDSSFIFLLPMQAFRLMLRLAGQFLLFSF